MEEIVIPFVDVALNPEEIEDEVWKILGIIRPSWNPMDVVVKALSIGYVNVMRFCHLKTDPEGRDGAVLVRVYGHILDNYFAHTGEVASLVMGHRAGCTGNVLAIYRNGIALEYVPGRSIRYIDLHNPHIARLIAETTAKFHCIDVDSVTVKDTRGKHYSIDKKYIEFDMLRRTVRATSYKKFDYPWMPTREELMQWVNDCEAHILSLDLPTVPTHFDVRTDNIIYDEKTDTVKLVDLEGASFSYPHRDLVLHFRDLEIYLEMGWADEGDPRFDEAQIRTWVRNYLEFRNIHGGKSTANVPEKDVNKFYDHLMNRFISMGHLIQGIVGIQFPDDVFSPGLLKRCFDLHKATRAVFQQQHTE